MIDEQVAKMIEMLGRIDSKTEALERAILGNGQPGLTQRVQDLEESRARMWGATAVLGTLAGIAEWFFHRK